MSSRIYGTGCYTEYTVQADAHAGAADASTVNIASGDFVERRSTELTSKPLHQCSCSVRSRFVIQSRSFVKRSKVKVTEPHNAQTRNAP